MREVVHKVVLEKLLEDENIIPVEAPVDANVWKVEVKEGQEVHDKTAVCLSLPF